jgi:beta-lactam-binding protein with PASTA domain
MKIAIVLVVAVIAVAALVFSLQYMPQGGELPPVTGQAVNAEEEALELLEKELEESLKGIADQELENFLLDQ